MNAITQITESRELLVNLTLRELRGKYKKSILGWTWSFLNPLSLMVIYTIVFGKLLGAGPNPGDPSGLDNFPGWLMCGLLAWNFVSGSLTGSMATLVGNAGLIKKVYFPRQLLTFATVLSLDVSYLIEMAVLAGYLFVIGNRTIVLWILPALLLIVLLTLFAAGLGLVFSVFNVYFRDVQYLVGIVMNLWFYLTPIVYPIKYVEKVAVDHPRLHLVGIYKLNPMYGFVESFRNVFYDLRAPSPKMLVYIAVWSVGTLALGMWVFRRFDGRLAEEL